MASDGISAVSSRALGELTVSLVTARPGLLALYGVGPDSAAMLLAAAGGRPRAAAFPWFRLMAVSWQTRLVARTPAESGKRHLEVCVGVARPDECGPGRRA